MEFRGDLHVVTARICLEAGMSLDSRFTDRVY